MPLWVPSSQAASAVSWKTADGIKVFTRRDWGAKPPRNVLAPLGQIRSVVIHHGGPVGGPRWTFKAAAQTCRDWQAYHQNGHGWSDIGYHYLVDARGRLYEGRPPDKLGAHVLAQNTGRVGINFMQDGRSHGLTWLQRRTLRKLFRVKHIKLGLPALKELAKHPGSEWGVFGHREVPGQSTECPGNLILRDLHTITKEHV
jgi:hypothetical protein